MAVLWSFICEGDSLSYQGGPPPAAVSYFNTLSGLTTIPGSSISNNDVLRLGFRWKYNGAIFCNCSIGGSKLSDISSRFVTHVQPLIQKSHGNPPLSAYDDKRPTRKFCLVLMAGTNPDTVDPTTHCNSVKTYLQTAASAGFDTFIICSFPNNYAQTQPAFDTFRLGVAAKFRDSAYISSIGTPTYHADFSGDPIMGASAAPADTTLFADGTHPTALGASYFYPIFNAQLNTVLAS